MTPPPPLARRPLGRRRSPAALRGRARLVWCSALLVAACAAASPPRTFGFASNLDAAAARACANDRLRALGFRLVATEDGLGATGLLRREPAAGRPPEWWHVALTVTPRAEGGTLVELVAGAGPRAEGPFEAPPGPLATAVAEIASRCTYP